jgi:hypothetical protein
LAAFASSAEPARGTLMIFIHISMASNECGGR